MTRVSLVFLFCAGSLALGCKTEDPKPGGEIPDASPEDGEACEEGELDPSLTFEDCSPAIDDYTPGEDNSANDSWPPCISDDNGYHQIEASISSISRVEAFDRIGELLWDNGSINPDDFVAARVIYEEEQGLGSRVTRRYDPHYPAPKKGTCEDPRVADKHPNYCVGPALLHPIILAAFAAGAGGEGMIVNGMKLKAALQWFLYVSTIKEATTCKDAPKDCDSCFAYYSGGTPRDKPIGLARDIVAFVNPVHNRVYDGVLAVRCWRDLDPGVPAQDDALQARAIAQLDAALLQGMAVLARQLFVAVGCSEGAYRRGAVAALEILVPFLDRETRERDPSIAIRLLDEIELDAEDIDIKGMLTAIDSVYDCP